MFSATDGADNYDEDFVSSASGSANEQSPSKEPDKISSLTKSQVTRESIVCSEEIIQSEEISEEIEEIEDIISSKSFVSINIHIFMISRITTSFRIN